MTLKKNMVWLRSVQRGLCCGMEKFVRPLALLALLVWGAAAQACAICAPSDAQNFVFNRFSSAQQIVLASSGNQAGQAIARIAIRGELPAQTLSVVDAQGTPTAWQPVPAKPGWQVLIRVVQAAPWQYLGWLPEDRLQWLQALAKLASAPPELQDGQLRAAFLLPELESPQDWIAQMAYEEIASQPYPTLRKLARSLNHRQVAQWVAKPTQTSRLPLYLLLMGHVAPPDQLRLMQASALSAGDADAAAQLSATAASIIALGGEPGLSWLEQNLLLQPKASDSQVQAVLLALSVHGNDGVAVSQARVVQSYARFVDAQPARAGFVASDLATWGHWEFAQAFAQALRTAHNPVFASRYAMVFYLLRNPRPEARSLVEELRAQKLM
jgi:hypothetical protein